MDNREIEAKFLITRPENLIHILSTLDAKLVSPRVHEWNYRFDTIDGKLTSTSQALRLRSDDRFRLTYKGPADLNSEVTDRKELEVEVSNLKTTQKILEALGYQIRVVYEKYRTTWHWDGVEIVFDELPFGNFCEIEGNEAAAIREAADKLNLFWDDRISSSYLSIFDQLKNKHGWKIEHLIFDDFRGIVINTAKLAEINIFPADSA